MAVNPPGALWEFEAIGTVWRIETASAPAPGVRAAVDVAIAAFDAAWSRFRPDSLVCRLGSGAGAVPSPPDAVAMLDAYDDLAAATAGAVNPLVGASLERLGYDAGCTLVPTETAPLAAPSDWRERLRADAERLSLTGGGTIDVGALGKGRLVDVVMNILSPRVGGDVVVDASGDLAVRGAPVRIGLEHPYDSSRAIGVWQVADAALCASASNRRAWGDGLHHVLDARSGAPVRSVVATWAAAPTAMRADAIATALFFDGGAELAFRWGVDWVRMLSDGSVEWSPSCPAELFRVGG